jgi:hypothetical protein
LRTSRRRTTKASGVHPAQPDLLGWFLTAPADISATNHESEFELRFNVIARRLSGGNRSEAGRQAQQTLPSIIRTCRKLGREPYDLLCQPLCSPTPLPLDTTNRAVN